MTELELSGIIRDYVAREVKPLHDRIFVLETTIIEREIRIVKLEAREPIRGERGERGELGPKGERGETGIIGERGPAGERGERGDPGIAGISGKDGRDGVDGKNGLDGKDGQPGRDGATGERGADGRNGMDGNTGPRGERGEIGPAGERGPQGERGADGPHGVGLMGLTGLQGERGPSGERGEPGPQGSDGHTTTRDELSEIVAVHSNEWALDFERRAQDILQRAVERIPAPKDGRDGKDGAAGRDGTNGKDAQEPLDLEDFDIQHNGDGLVTFTFKRGPLEKRFEIRLPRFKYHGVFEEGRNYREGDGVTSGGSLWLALKDAPEGKPGSSDGWQLAVKKGSDGRDGKSIKGDPGPQGPAGRDLRYE